MTATADGREVLNAKFKFCESLTKPEDHQKLFGKHLEFIHQSFFAYLFHEIDLQIIWKTFISFWRRTICHMELLVVYRCRLIQSMRFAVT